MTEFELEPKISTSPSFPFTKLLSLLNISKGGSLWARFHPIGELRNQGLCDLIVAKTNGAERVTYTKVLQMLAKPDRFPLMPPAV